MTHADEARRIVDAMKTCQTNHPEKWLEPIAAALAAAERAGIERAIEWVDKRERDFEAAMVGKWHSPMSSPNPDTMRRALLPAAVAEPAAKCGMGLSSVFVGTNGELPPQESHPVAKCPRGHGEMTGANPEFGTPACSACGAEPAAKCSRGDKGCGETPCVCGSGT